MLRRIFLDITNAGQDDGVPTSHLREIAILKSLKHPRINQLLCAQLHQNRVQLLFEHQRFNLKEFVRNYSSLQAPESSYLREVRQNKSMMGLDIGLVKRIML